MRTYSREQFEGARAEWDAGEFSDEWKPYRHAAAMRGFIWPPQGSKWDSWSDDSPTQRAILIQMIRDRPAATLAAIERSRSWREVIDELIREREWLTEQSRRADDEDRAARPADEPTTRQATAALKAILGGLDA